MGVMACAGARFVPKPEERLLSVVHALLHRCYKLPYAQTADIPDSLRGELTGAVLGSVAHLHACSVLCGLLLHL